MKQGSQRQHRVAELVREELALAFAQGKLANPALQGYITVSEVDISADLRSARVLFSCLGTADLEPKAIEKLLEAEAPRLQKHLGRVLAIKYTPRLKFVYDDSFDRAAHIDALLAGKKAG